MTFQYLKSTALQAALSNQEKSDTRAEGGIYKRMACWWNMRAILQNKPEKSIEAPADTRREIPAYTVLLRKKVRSMLPGLAF